MRLHAAPVCAAPLRSREAAARLRASRPQPPPRLLPPRPPLPPARPRRLARPRLCASSPAAGEDGAAEAWSDAPPAAVALEPLMDIEAAEVAMKDNIQRYGGVPRPLRFPLFLFYSLYDNEAFRKLFYTFFMMISYFYSYNIPVPGLLPYRQGVGYSMDHLSALFMNDPAVSFVSIMHIGYQPFLVCYLLGSMFMATPIGHNWRKGRSRQAAQDEIFEKARQVGFAFVVFKVLYLQPFFRHIAMPAVKDLHWFEFFAVTGCPLLWGSTMSIYFLTEVINTGLVDGFAMAISGLTASMVTQVVVNWFFAFQAGHTLEPLRMAAIVAVYVAHVCLVVLLINCQRRIELVFFARKSGGGLNVEQEEAFSTFVPIKAVPSVITPILVAEMLTGGLNSSSAPVTIGMYVGTIMSLCLVDFNNVPKELAETLTKMGTRVPGVRPGTATVAFLQDQQSMTRLFGGLCFLALVFISMLFNLVLGSFGHFFSFTSNIVLVAAVMQGLQNWRALTQKPKKRGRK